MSEPPDRPKAPDLADFGLTAEGVAAITAVPITSRLFKIAGGLFLVSTVLLMVACSNSGDNRDNQQPIFLVFFLVWMLTGLSGLLVDWIVKPWEQAKIAASFGVDLAKLVEYHGAEAKYHKRSREYDEWFGRSQRAFWLSLSPNQFEHEVARVYRRLGYSAQVTKQSRDGGVDVILRAEHGTTIVQCKAHQRKIGVKAFRELYGVIADFGAESAILVCLHGATDDARKFMRGKPIRVVMLNDLVQMSRELADDIAGDGDA